MQYPVKLIETEEGFAVSCPSLPGCHSQGTTRKEALANIRKAISLWLEVAQEDAARKLGCHITRKGVQIILTKGEKRVVLPRST